MTRSGASGLQANRLQLLARLGQALLGGIAPHVQPLGMNEGDISDVDETQRL